MIFEDKEWLNISQAIEFCENENKRLVYDYNYEKIKNTARDEYDIIDFAGENLFSVKT